ncbi:hypothetical protein V1509DRAFT_626875 [Lipomyces kononenkoae]
MMTTSLLSSVGSSPAQQAAPTAATTTTRYNTNLAKFEAQVARDRQQLQHLLLHQQQQLQLKHTIDLILLQRQTQTQTQHLRRPKRTRHVARFTDSDDSDEMETRGRSLVRPGEDDNSDDAASCGSSARVLSSSRGVQSDSESESEDECVSENEDALDSNLALACDDDECEEYDDSECESECESDSDLDSELSDRIVRVDKFKRDVVPDTLRH